MITVVVVVMLGETPEGRQQQPQEHRKASRRTGTVSEHVVRTWSRLRRRNGFVEREKYGRSEAVQWWSKFHWSLCCGGYYCNQICKMRTL